jgi:type IX secretion system PorP/SprF family membrane protein
VETSSYSDKEAGMKKYYCILVLTIGSLFDIVSAQDPHFTQFYSAPLTVNPAYTGVFRGQVRFMSNYRQQWNSLASPFTTVYASLDGKIGAQPEVGQNPFNMGVQFMTDRSMKGAFLSNYISGSAAYHVTLDYDGYKTIGAGLSASYGDRRIDFSGIAFDAQFASGGFNLSLPNGEAALQNMKPFVSVGAGLLYRYDNTFTGEFFDIGISGYHFNKPRQTVLNDPTQFLPLRIAAQISWQKYLNDNTILNLKGLYQTQASVSYVLGGFSLAKLMGDPKNMIGAGCWYRSGEAVSPYLFIEYDHLLLGVTYDMVMGDLSKGPKPARATELSLQWRLGQGRENRVGIY